MAVAPFVNFDREVNMKLPVKKSKTLAANKPHVDDKFLIDIQVIVMESFDCYVNWNEYDDFSECRNHQCGCGNIAKKLKILFEERVRKGDGKHIIEENIPGGKAWTV
jgi:hypothetical protein